MTKKQKDFFRKTSGITIVALVVTIVVLIMLTTVSINAVFGESGILSEAEKSKNMKANSIVAEQEDMNIILSEYEDTTLKAKEKRTVEFAVSEASGTSIKLDKNNLQVALNKRMGNDASKTQVTADKDEEGTKGFLVKFTETENYYFVENGKVRYAKAEEFSKGITAIYAILYSDGDLRFNTTGNIDATKTANGATVVLKSSDISNTQYSYSTDSRPWASNKANIKTITIEEKIVLKYGTALFKDLTNLEKINGIEKIFTDNVEDFIYTFYGCSKLQELDVSGFNTSKATNMKSMFRLCSNLKELDLSSFDTSEVKEMHNMFYGCTNLEGVDLSTFNTANVTQIFSMFEGCTNLKKIDLSTFDTSSVTDIKRMFLGCTSLEEIEFSDKFVATNITDMNFMFNECNSLKTLDLSSFKETKATNMQGMFYNCKNLTSLDISNFDTSSVTNMYATFYACSNLLLIDMRSASFEQVTSYSGMFDFKNLNLKTKIIVKDDEDNFSSKEWIENRVAHYGSKATVVTVSELE